MARLRSCGWLVLKRQGARGRVSVYGMDLARILEDTRRAWPQIGEDFIARLSPETPPMGQGASNVVPLRTAAPPIADGSVWSAAQARLFAEDSAIYGAWFHSLTDVGIVDGCLTLTAPTRFHATYVASNLRERLMSILRCVDPSLREVKIIA